MHSRPLPELRRVRDRLRAGDRFVRSSAANVAYTALDSVTDEYQLAIEVLAERVDALERKLLSERRPNEPVAHLEDDLFTLKNHLASLRRIVVPQRDKMGALSDPADERLVSEESRRYFQDARIHLDRAVDSLDTMREYLTGISEAYTTRATRLMNQQLTRLTAISTLFLPLGFITGLYGMNFVGIPEVHYKYGYYVVLVVFVILIGFVESLVSRDGVFTPLYTYAKRPNNRLKVLGKVLLPLTSESVVHANENPLPKGARAFKADGYIKSVSGSSVILGRFRDPAGGAERYLLVTNRSFANAAQTVLKLSDSVSKVLELDNQTGAFVPLAQQGSILLSIAPGGARLYLLRNN